jgi:hypothetical protein
MRNRKHCEVNKILIYVRNTVKTGFLIKEEITFEGGLISQGQVEKNVE